MGLQPASEQGVVAIFDQRMSLVRVYNHALIRYKRAGTEIIRTYEHVEREIEWRTTVARYPVSSELIFLEWFYHDLKLILDVYHVELSTPGFEPDQIEDPFLRYGLKFAIERDLDA